MQVGSDADAGAASVVGPLNALEADRFVEDLSTIAFEDVGGHRWMHQHECLEKLNIQAHVNASQQRDEFVMEALVLHQKIPLLIRELVASELWKANAFPLLKDWLAEHNSVKGYLLLYHEAVICNLLEAVLYHKEACEAAGELIAELADYCHRKVVWLLGQKPPPRPSERAVAQSARPRPEPRSVLAGLALLGGALPANFSQADALPDSALTYDALLALDRYDEALACLGAIESNREAAALMRKTRAAQRRATRMEAAYGKCLSAAFSDGLGDTRSGVRRRRSGEAETERALRKAARAAAAHDWALVVWVVFCVVVVGSYVLWGEALVRYLLLPV